MNIEEQKNSSSSTVWKFTTTTNRYPGTYRNNIIIRVPHPVVYNTVLSLSLSLRCGIIQYGYGTGGMEYDNNIVSKLLENMKKKEEIIIINK